MRGSNILKMDSNLEEVILKLVVYIRKQQFKGFDPYDIHNSEFALNKLPHKLQFFLSQINKRSPINFRRLLHIEGNYHTKAMAIFMSAFCVLYQKTKNKKHLNDINFIYNWIKRNANRNFSGTSWGFDYSYTNRYELIEKGLPTVIHVSYVLKALYGYYKIVGDKEIMQLIVDSKDFILRDIPQMKFQDGICFGYYPNYSGCCYNASLHAAESLAIINIFQRSPEIEKKIELAVNYVVSKQKSNGAWFYSHNGDEEDEKKQIDFHQGFIIESLIEINKLTKYKFHNTIDLAIKKGADFYLINQFNQDGSSKYRLPKKYPIDIHNQAQGIITFSKLQNHSTNYKNMAGKIVNWTINNMRSNTGYFYFQKYKFLTNKISYIRWSQAWMFLALTEYLPDIYLSDSSE